MTLTMAPIAPELSGIPDLKDLIPSNWKIDGRDEIMSGDTVLLRAFNEKLPKEIKAIYLLSLYGNDDGEKTFRDMQSFYNEVYPLCIFSHQYFPNDFVPNWLKNEIIYFALGWDFNFPNDNSFFLKFKKMIPLYTHMGDTIDKNRCSFCPLSLLYCTQTFSKDCDAKKISSLKDVECSLWVSELVGGDTFCHKYLTKSGSKRPNFQDYVKELKDEEIKQAANKLDQPLPKLLPPLFE